MSDLISRQAAIDALGERPMVWAESDYELGARNQYDADVLALETVPPADTDLSAYSDKLWKAAYERGKKEAEAERKHRYRIEKKRGNMRGYRNYLDFRGVNTGCGEAKGGQ